MCQRVLMIDDSVPLHRLVAARLAGQDVELHSASDGSTGLAMAADLRPAVILLDVDLPDVDGFEVCRRLGASVETADIPVIFLTAEGGRRQAGLDLGAAGYVTKPFRTGELSDRVAATIRDRLARQASAGLDGVTGLWTRAAVARHLADRAAEPAACVVADVDGLRLVNARHGSPVGDAVLRAVGGAFAGHCRGVCGAGGGRFAAVLPGDRRAGRALAEAVRDALAATPIAEVRITCGFGVADTAVAAGPRLLGRAESALAHAKRAGPGHVAVARRHAA